MQEISEKSLDKDDKEEAMVMSLSDGEIIPEENDLKEGSDSKCAHIHQQGIKLEGFGVNMD